MIIIKIIISYNYNLNYWVQKDNSECIPNIYDNATEKEWFQTYGGSENESHGQ